MAQKRRKTEKAEAAEGDGIEMTDLRTPEHGVQAGSLLHMSSLILQMGEYMSTVDATDKTDDVTSSSSDSDDDEHEGGRVMVRSNTRIGSMLVANKAAGRHWQAVRADSSAIAQIMRLRDVADELIAAAETEQLVASAEKAAMENDENAASITVCNRREDNETGETTWELPDDASITEEEESTLELGQAPQPPEDPAFEELPRKRLHQFSVSVTEDGDKYFINNETQETAWYLPEDGEVVEI
jgi:hypothetical protein